MILAQVTDHFLSRSWGQFESDQFCFCRSVLTRLRSRSSQPESESLVSEEEEEEDEEEESEEELLALRRDG